MAGVRLFITKSSEISVYARGEICQQLYKELLRSLHLQLGLTLLLGYIFIKKREIGELSVSFVQFRFFSLPSNWSVKTLVGCE